ncbi:MAG: Fic family protein [Oscillospiraceae bacterium]|nr:Fic family protein [Oscillospiraceae bacterium]
MKVYNYKNRWERLLTPEIVSMLTQIHEYKGKMFAESNSDTLTHLVETAKIQSTEASNKIEGIYTSDERIKKLALSKTNPQNRNEEEIAGYRDVLNTIHTDHDVIPLKPNIILQLHRDLYRFNTVTYGGQYKNVDNVITEEDADGNKFIRFNPVEAWEVPESMDKLCSEFNEATASEAIDTLLAIPMFILDFLCIHPFNDGNGRMSRLLTLLLLYRSGYTVGKYISIEKLIETTKETYYDALQKSSDGWHENNNDYAPFVKYMLSVILAAYREFDSRIQLMTESNLSKPERVAKIIEDTLGKVTKQDILKKCPDISETTVQRALSDLLKTNKIIKIGGGRYTSYIWNREEEL